MKGVKQTLQGEVSTGLSEWCQCLVVVAIITKHLDPSGFTLNEI